MAEKEMRQGMEDLMTTYKTLFFDLPLAGMRWGLGLGGEKETVETAWKGYDATVRLTTAAIDNLYRTPLFGEVTGRALEGVLRWQWVSNAVAGAFFTGLWQAVGLPTATETRALRSEVQALREEIRSQSLGLRVKRKEAKTSTQSDELRKNGVVNVTRAAA